MDQGFSRGDWRPLSRVQRPGYRGRRQDCGGTKLSCRSQKLGCRGQGYRWFSALSSGPSAFSALSSGPSRASAPSLGVELAACAASAALTLQCSGAVASAWGSGATLSLWCLGSVPSMLEWCCSGAAVSAGDPEPTLLAGRRTWSQEEFFGQCREQRERRGSPVCIWDQGGTLTEPLLPRHCTGETVEPWRSQSGTSRKRGFHHRVPLRRSRG